MDEKESDLGGRFALTGKKQTFLESRDVGAEAGSESS